MEQKIELNDEPHGTYNVNSQIKFKTSMLRSILYDYTDAYILASSTITVPYTSADGAAVSKAIEKKYNN